MSEQIKALSWNTSRAFEWDERQPEREHIIEELDRSDADILFLSEAAHGEIGVGLRDSLKQLGYHVLAAARTIDRRDDVHAMSDGVDIMNVIAWRDVINQQSIDIVELGTRSGFVANIDNDLPLLLTHFDDWSTEGRRAMADDALAIFGSHTSPFVIAGDINAASPRVRTPAYRMLSSAPYQAVVERICDTPLAEYYPRSANILRRLGEIASDDLHQRLEEHGLRSVLPPVPTFDGRHAGVFGRKLQLGLDDIFSREHPDYTVTDGAVGSLDSQPDKLDHAPVSAVIKF